jgi:integrase
MSVYRDKARDRWIFEFDTRVHGQRIRARKILPKTWTKAQAEAFGRKEGERLFAQVRGGERDAHTIDDAVALYIDHHCSTLKAGDGTAAELARMHWAYTGKTLEQLADACREIANEGRKDGAKPATIRNRIRYLTAACRYAWKHHGFGEHDPAARVAVPAVSNERHIYATREEMVRIARAIKPQNKHANNCAETRAVLRIGFYSGMRLSEILSAKLVNNDDFFFLGTTKNGKPRLVPIHPKIRSCLWIYRRPMPAKRTVQKQFTLARDRVGLGHFHFHDIRHSAASEMINAGVDLYTVGAVLGHQDSRSTQRYAHLATATLTAAVGKIGQKITHPPKKKTA